MRTLQRTLNSMFGMGKAPRQPDTQAKARAAFKRLATQHGFTWRKARDGYLELDPFPALPEGLTTAFHGWDDALDRVTACIADPSLCANGSYSE